MVYFCYVWRQIFLKISQKCFPVNDESVLEGYKQYFRFVPIYTDKTRKPNSVCVTCRRIFVSFLIRHREIFLTSKTDAERRGDKLWDWLLFVFDATRNLQMTVSDKASAIFRFSTKTKIIRGRSFWMNQVGLNGLVRDFYLSVSKEVLALRLH